MEIIWDTVLPTPFASEHREQGPLCSSISRFNPLRPNHPMFADPLRRGGLQHKTIKTSELARDVRSYEVVVLVQTAKNPFPGSLQTACRMVPKEPSP